MTEKIKFFLLDINSEVVDGQAEIRLWGVDEHGSSILVRDRSYRPYFYLIPKDDADPEKLANEVSRTVKEQDGIDAEIEIVSSRFYGRQVDAVRVSFQNPDDTQRLVKSVMKLEGIKSHLEDDLRYSMHYLIDNNVSPSSWLEVDCDEVDLAGLLVDRVFEAKGTLRVQEDYRMPPLKVMAFDMVAVGKRGSPEASRDSISLISVTTSSGSTHSLVADEQGEKALLESFVQLIQSYDPDVIIGFGNNRIDWPFMIQRARILGINLCVDRAGTEPHTSLYGHVSVTGRVNLDLYDMASDIAEIKIKSLDALARFLGIPVPPDRLALEEVDFLRYWNDPALRSLVIKHSSQDATIILQGAIPMLEAAIELSSLTGLPLDHVVAAAVGFRVDWYLARQARRLNELVPPRREQPYIPYRGAIVLEPKSGLHENVAVLDFTSMYPNLMILYNLSPDTLVSKDEVLAEKDVNTIPGLEYKFRKSPQGFYKTVLSDLIQARQEIKRKLKEEDPNSVSYRLLKEREKAIKTITNACYGYAGWTGARWYAPEVAESAAALGRRTIKQVLDKARQIGLKVIYGDTDALFVYYDQAKVDALLAWVSDELKLEIRAEKIYKRILFTEAKKRYAGVLPNGEVEAVGLEVVRGDWSEIARKVQDKVIQLVLEDGSEYRAVKYVRQLIAEIGGPSIPIQDYVIWKTINKPIEEYEVRAPHVEAAKIMRRDGWDIHPGDKIGYIIVRGQGKLFERARPYPTVSLSEVDVDYYKLNQVLPAALRILGLFGATEESLLQGLGQARLT
jgi:DNA polymerase I